MVNFLASSLSGAPGYSTATYPNTTTASQLLYSSGTNTVGGLTTGNNGVLVTDGSGVPSISSTLPTAVQGNITSVGTISSGTWSGTAIATNKGGSGSTNFSGNLTLISSQTATNVATLDFTSISSTYKIYLVQLYNVLPATNSVTLQMRFGTGAGPSWDAGTNYETAGKETTANGGVDGNVNGTGQTVFRLSTTTVSSTAANSGCSGFIYIYNPASGSQFPLGVSKIASVNTVPVVAWTDICLRYASTTAVTGFRFLFSAGNIISGTINVYGVN